MRHPTPTPASTGVGGARIGWTSVLFGAVYLAQNLLIHDDVVSSTLFRALGFASAGATAALALDLARPASLSGRRFVAVVSAAGPWRKARARSPRPSGAGCGGDVA